MNSPPILRWWQVPYYWFGIKMYDVVAGDRNVKSSYYLSKKNTLELFPMLKSDNLCGGIVYYDGKNWAPSLLLQQCQKSRMICQWSISDFTIVYLFIVDYQTCSCQNDKVLTIMRSVIDHSDTTATAD